MKNVELQVGYGREGVMPYVGFEWCLEDTTVTINGETSVSDMKHLMGAQGGVRYEFPLFRYLVSQSGLSVSFLNARYQRSIDESRQHSDRFFLPRSKLMLGLLFSYPVKGDVGISLYGGYEMQYLWERGMDQKIQWEDPIALQGVNLNFSIRY
ncbi:MAG: hypothetical protein KDK64_02180 [Chlamydiia bacterium]|nr:hypothetical protein [Chlamydiia bacterium]